MPLKSISQSDYYITGLVKDKSVLSERKGQKESNKDLCPKILKRWKELL